MAMSLACIEALTVACTCIPAADPAGHAGRDSRWQACTHTRRQSSTDAITATLRRSVVPREGAVGSCRDIDLRSQDIRIKVERGRKTGHGEQGGKGECGEEEGRERANGVGRGSRGSATQDWIRTATSPGKEILVAQSGLAGQPPGIGSRRGVGH